MALGSTLSLTEMSTRNLPGSKGDRRVRLTTLPPFVNRLIVSKTWEHRRLTTLWASTVCYRVKFTFSPSMLPTKKLQISSDPIANKTVYVMWHSLEDNWSEEHSICPMWIKTHLIALSLFIRVPSIQWGRDSSVGIATRLRAGILRNRDSTPSTGKRFVFSPQRPEQLWGPPSLLSNGSRGLFPRSKAVETRSWTLISIQCRDQEWWSYTSAPPYVITNDESLQSETGGCQWGYWHCGHSWPIVPASGDSEDDCGEADGM
jgi:hypothetical protein